MIDLHCHSIFSDGQLSPEILLNKALQAQIRVLALTDHDTVAGLAALHTAALGKAIKIINGIELTARWKKYDIHIIGLNFFADDHGLAALIAQQNQNRVARAKKIAEALAQLGIENTYQKACAIAGHERVGRPHFAQILINEGYAADMKSAFNRFLARGRPAYIATQWASVEQIVTTITQAGGQAVIAHPLKYKLTRSKLHELIKQFKTAGGEGLEVISGGMNTLQINELSGICTRFELLASTGSDYHGDTLSRVSLGQQAPLPLNCRPIWHQWTI